MRFLRNGISFLVVATLTACGSAPSSAPLAVFSPVASTPSVTSPSSTPAATPTATVKPTSTPTATPMPTPTPTAAPATVATTVPLGNGMALANAPVTMAVPAPTGFAQTISVPLVNAPAGTTVAVTAGASPAPGIATLGVARNRRGPLATSDYSTMFYDSIVPSANITVAGAISFTQSFPAGVLSPAASYYLAFYDTTAASPAWQTIAGPVMASGQNLTFSGSTSSITLVAGKLYGFATFTGATPSATPPPAPQTLLYFGGSGGISITDEGGNLKSTLAIPNQTFDLDDAGNVYADDSHHGQVNGMGGSDLFAMFPAGTATAGATYTPSVAGLYFASVSGAGEVIAVHNVNMGSLVTDVWDPGKSGPPSRTLTTTVPTGFSTFVLTHDGTIYLPDRSAAGVPQFDIFPPGATAPSKVIPETIVPASQYNSFSPNYSAVGADGTLYVTEYSFDQPDPNAGLYIYPLNGPERFVPAATNANGPGPQGVDIDASGTIYVDNNNSAILTSSTCQGDTLQDVSVYDQQGTLLRTVTGTPGAFPVTAASDGTVFLSSFAIQLQSSCAKSGTNGTYAIAPGATAATEISTNGSSTIVLYDGTHKTEPFSHQSHGGLSSSGHGGGLSTRRGIVP